jgi:inner membrane protein
MPTAFTHALAAGAFASIGPRSISRTKLALSMAILAILPDIDVVGFRLGISYGDVIGHRGLTHSLAFAFFCALTWTLIAFRSARMFGPAWWATFGLLLLAAASHGFLDAFTDAGLGVGFFIPFDNTRYFFPWRPLATSPLSVEAFISGPALRILANELMWVGIPTACVLLVGHGARVIWRRRGA